MIDIEEKYSEIADKSDLFGFRGKMMFFIDLVFNIENLNNYNLYIWSILL